MPHPTRRTASQSATWYCLAVGLVLVGSAAPGQQTTAPPLRVGGLSPTDLRGSATGSWAKYDFELTNSTDTARRALVVLFFPSRPDVQYAREVWVPARTQLKSWMLVGPAPANAGPGENQHGRTLEFLLYDRTDGTDRLILPPSEERVRSRSIPYRRREPSTAIVLDEHVPEPPPDGLLPQPDSASDEAMYLARTFRATRELPVTVTVVGSRLPPTPEGFDAIDHLVIASNRVKDDPAGLRALRQWLAQGGRVWVQLDRVEAETVAPLLGDALDFHTVGRVPLTDFRIEARTAGAASAEPQQSHERPVTLTRVLLPAGEQPWHTVNGWPAWFSRPVGAGTVVFSTLGPRGWYAPRRPGDPPSPDLAFPTLPFPGLPLARLADELQLPPDADAFRVESFQRPLAEEIGYTIPGRGTVVLIFLGAAVAAVAAGVALRHSRHPELLGWLGPAAAVVAAVVLFALGESSRRAAPPTLAEGQVVQGIAGTEEAAVRGLLALYRPDSGPLPLAAERGGLIDLDIAEQQATTRRLVLTDAGVWHWESLALPAGVRTGTFQGAFPTGKPVDAVGRFVADGIDGKLSAGALQGVSDAILAAPAGSLPVRLLPDGRFRAVAADAVPPGKFLPEALLSDRQQRRQALYRDYLRRPPERPVLLAWAKPVDLGFAATAGARAAGDALVVFPLRLERAAVGDSVTVPAALIPCRRVKEAGLLSVAREYNQGADLQLRFQLPTEVLPLQVERARLLIRVNAPGRQVTISGGPNGGAATQLYSGEGMPDAVRFEVVAQPWLKPDEGGGLHFHLAVGAAPPGGGIATDKWTLEQLELEVVGRTGSN